MATLTSKRRNALASNQFAGPDRSYPIPDRSHAANAKARAVQQYDAGHISKAVEEHIIGKANRKLGK